MSTWVLLRGLSRESRHWGSFPSLLRDEVRAERVITPDLPGNGSRCDQVSPATVADLAQASRAELLRAGLAPPFFLLGMSLGAMIATEWAAGFPDEVRGCVLINTSMRPFSPFYWRLRPANYVPVVRLLLLSDPVACERLVLRMTSRRHAKDSDVLSEWSALRRERPVSRINGLRQLLAAARYRAPAKRPAHALVLASRHDALVDVRCSRRLAAAWQSDYAEHPQAGHDLALDDAPWITQRVAAWLAGCTGAGDAWNISTPRVLPSTPAPVGAGSRDGEPDLAR